MRYRTTLAAFALLAVAALGLPRGNAAPDGAWSLADRVPDTAWGYAAMEDVGSWPAHFEKTAIYQLVTHPDMQTFVEPLAEGLAKMTTGGGPMGDMPPPVQELLAHVGQIKGDLAVALLDVERTRGTPSLIASLDFGEHAAAFAEALQGFRREVDPDGQHIREETKDGRTYWHMDANGMPITATVYDSALVVSNDPVALEAVIAGKVETPLSANKSYQYIRSKAGGDQLAVFGFANMGPIVEMMDAQMSPRELDMARSMGVDTLHGVGFGIAFEGDGFRDSLIVHAPNPTHGFMNLMRYQPLTPEALKWMPASTFYYSESKGNFDEYLGNIRTLMTSMDAGAGNQIDEMMKQVQTQLGVDIEAEVLKQLDGQIAVYAAMPETGGLYPEVAVFLKAKDGDAFEAAMTRLVEGAAGVITENGTAVSVNRTMKFREHTLHLLELEGARRRQLIPFTPTWTRLQDKWFAITLVPHTMKELILRATGTAEPGLAQQEDFKSVLAASPEGTGAVSYIDTQALMALLYDTGVPMLQTIAKPNLMPRQFPPLDFAALPPTRLIRPYLRSMGMYASWTDEGMSVSSYGPIPIGAVLVTAIVAGVVFGGARMDSRSTRVRMMPPRAVTEVAKPPSRLGEVQRSIAEMHARDLARQVRIYILEHAAMPPNLATLVEQEQLKSVPQDPWNHPYELDVTNAEQKTFRITSVGPDGKKGTKDDVLVDG